MEPDDSLFDFLRACQAKNSKAALSALDRLRRLIEQDIFPADGEHGGPGAGELWGIVAQRLH